MTEVIDFEKAKAEKIVVKTDEQPLRLISPMPIGTNVFYHSTNVEGEITISKGVVLGAFINKVDGELFYFVDNVQIPAYCVFESEETMNESLKTFDEFRKDLHERNALQIKLFKEFKKDFLFDEYKQIQTKED